jgi:hypothetical protein
MRLFLEALLWQLCRGSDDVAPVPQPPEPGQEGWGSGPRCYTCERRTTFAGDHTPSPSVAAAAAPSALSGALRPLPNAGEDEAATACGTAGPPPPGPSVSEPQASAQRAGGGVRVNGGQAAAASAGAGTAAAKPEDQAALLRGLAESYVWCVASRGASGP